MSENEQGTFKPQFGAELNIESIIGAPLVAASKANVMMLTGQDSIREIILFPTLKKLEEKEAPAAK